VFWSLPFFEENGGYMNRCTNCGAEKLTAGEQPVTRDVGERTFEGFVQGWSCAACGERYYDAADLGSFEEAAAKWLAEHGVRTPEELKFMRKAVGIRAADLATWLDVSPETISHWETGKHAPDVVTRSTIAAIVLDTLRGESATLDRLRAQGKPEGTRKVRLGRDAA
jgi:putative zinc finger/helix-turn-helix YgiT family protein